MSEQAPVSMPFSDGKNPGEPAPEPPKAIAGRKYSVFLPKTDFPMKADLPQREPKRLERWKAEGLYHRIEALRKAEALFA